MSENCSHNCGSCSSDCSSRKPADFLVPPNEHSKIKKVIAVVSGKGGVGKSMVTSTMAVLTNRRGKKTAILDADITGPSIPKAFGVTEKAYGTQMGILPCESKKGIEMMSVNLLLERAGYCGNRKAVLEGCCLGGCGLYVHRYATRHRRCSADCFPVYRD